MDIVRDVVCVVVKTTGRTTKVTTALTCAVANGVIGGLQTAAGEIRNGSSGPTQIGAGGGDEARRESRRPG
jgi:hypothetical protein